MRSALRSRYAITELLASAVYHTMVDLYLIVSLHLEAGPAEVALVSLARQTRVNVLWINDVDSISKQPIAALDGRYTIAASWYAALKGTGLVWYRVNDTIAVSRAVAAEYDEQCPSGVE